MWALQELGNQITETEDRKYCHVKQLLLFAILFFVFGVYLIFQLGLDAYEQSYSDGGPDGLGGSGFGHPFGDVFSKVLLLFLICGRHWHLSSAIIFCCNQVLSCVCLRL